MKFKRAYGSLNIFQAGLLCWTSIHSKQTNKYEHMQNCLDKVGTNSHHLPAFQSTGCPTHLDSFLEPEKPITTVRQGTKLPPRLANNQCT